MPKFFRPNPISLALAGGAILLLPFAYLAGWLGDLGRVQPALSALSQARQNLAWQASRRPQEPPGAAPTVQTQWTDSTVTLSWGKIPHATSYTIYRAGGSQSLSEARVLAQITPRSALSYTDAAVSPGQAYSYWIAADNAVGEGPLSAVVKVHTYLSWNTVAQMGESAARTLTELTWSKTAWGILGQTTKSQSAPAWNLGGTIFSAMTPMNAGRSTWLTQHGTRWNLGATPVTATVRLGMTVVSGAPHLPSLASGKATQEDLALWNVNGRWATALVSPSTTPLPPNALVLNAYGAAVGLTGAVGSLQPISH